MPPLRARQLRRALMRFILFLASVVLATACHGGADPPSALGPGLSTQGVPAGVISSPKSSPSPAPPDVTCPAYSPTSPLPAGDLASPFPTAEAGTIPGAFAVTPTGEATYSMPLVTPPGRAGVEPHLALVYNSGGGNGVLGMGFSITGFSAVTRCSSNIAQDGRLRAVRYDDEDALCLDGARLVPIHESSHAVDARAAAVLDARGPPRCSTPAPPRCSTRSTPEPAAAVLDAAGCEAQLSLPSWRITESPSTDVGPGESMMSLERISRWPVPSAPMTMLPKSPACRGSVGGHAGGARPRSRSRFDLGRRCHPGERPLHFCIENEVQWGRVGSNATAALKRRAMAARSEPGSSSSIAKWARASSASD